MKKIVALVLSLVMVLGLATVAFADTTTTELKVADGYVVYAIDGTTAGTDSATAVFTKTVTGAVTTTSGTTTTVEYTATQYKADTGAYWNEVDASIADSKLVNTKTNTVVAYLKFAGNDSTLLKTSTVVDSTVASVKVAALATCGDYVDANGTPVYFVKDAAYFAGAGGNWAVLNGKFVSLGADAATAKVNHKLAANTYAAATGKADTLKCSVCQKVFTVLAPEAVKTMAPAAYAYDATLQVYYATGAVSAPVAGDKVESAETFDAGIAMYVGMSVMAAAGSAVVLKKKD